MTLPRSVCINLLVAAAMWHQRTRLALIMSAAAMPLPPHFASFTASPPPPSSLDRPPAALGDVPRLCHLDAPTDTQRPSAPKPAPFAPPPLPNPLGADQQCGETGVSNGGCFVVGQVAVAAFIFQTDRDEDQVICELTTCADATYSAALSQFQELNSSSR